MDATRVERFDPRAVDQELDGVAQLVDLVGRREYLERLPDDLVSLVTVETGRGRVARRDDGIERRGEDRVLGRLDDRREQVARSSGRLRLI